MVQIWRDCCSMLHNSKVSGVKPSKPSTMLSSNVQSIDLPMDCMAWQFWMMRQWNGCSTPAPRSSAAKQWFQQLAQKKKNQAKLPEIGCKSPVCSSVFATAHLCEYRFPSLIHLKKKYRNRLNPSNDLRVPLSNCVPRNERIIQRTSNKEVTRFVSDE